ncbi:MAG: sigma-70 family RNA polymerase sigma factor [Acidobacteria bacterium]|nr:sigma-70 family RNA polymerase sigma factor [Acidobacteriota bacterium]
MVVTEEKLREAIAPTAPFSPTNEAGLDVCSDTWAEAEFEQIFQTHYGRIVAVLFRLTGNRAQAEELAGEVFWKIYRQPLPADQDHNVGGWLYRVATRLGIDALRAQARRKHYEQAAGAAAYESGTTNNDPLADVLRDEKRQRVRAVLAAMKPAQSQLLLLRQSGLSYQELAEVFGVKTSSIGTLLARAEAEFEKRFRALYGALQ